MRHPDECPNNCMGHHYAQCEHEMCDEPAWQDVQLTGRDEQRLCRRHYWQAKRAGIVVYAADTRSL